MKQPKKSNTNIRYSLGNNVVVGAQFTGKVVKKRGTIKEKLSKNQSQLPIGLFDQSKQNVSLANLMLARPHSSLVASDISGSLSKSREKVDLNSFCKDKIKLKKIGSKRNTLSIADAQAKPKKVLRASNSQKKWNNRSVEQDPSILKFQIAQNRKKYNLSCGDMIQSKSKCKEPSVAKGKKKSLQPSKPQQQKPQKKSQKQESQQKKFKPTNLKSKGSTAVIGVPQSNQQQKLKLNKKQNKQNKRKKRSQSKSKSHGKKNSKSNKMIVIIKGDEDDKSIQDPDYPINKYVDMKKGKKSFNIKVGVDYRYTGINILSASSGPIGEFSSSIQRTFDNKILASLLQPQPSDSLNIEQIRNYQLHSPLKKEESLLRTHRHLHKSIKKQLQQQYPYLNSTQLNFLASVVLIQRKWRQYQLFKQLNQRRQIVTQYLVQEEDKSRDKSRQRFKQQFQKRDKKNEKFQSSKSGNMDKMDGMSRTKIAEYQGLESKIEQQKDIHEYQTRKNSPKNQIIIYSGSQLESLKESIKNENQLTDRKPITETNRLTVNYSHILSNEIFPQITYLEYRKNIIRKEYEKTMKLIADQKHSHQISEGQFQFKKNDILQMYQRQITELKKTKHDIKKGYLKYIDCINKIKEISQDGSPRFGKINNKYGMRKVSSDSNFLSTLYEKIFKFDKCISEWSGGSESIEMLTKKILIRKQFYKNEKKSQRRSLSDLRSAARSSYELIRSCRDAQNNTVIVFQNTDRLAHLQSSQKIPQQPRQVEDRIQNVHQFKFSNQIFKSKQEKQQPSEKQQLFIEHNQQEDKKDVQNGQQSEQNEPKFTQTRDQPEIKVMTNSISLLQSPQLILQRIEDQIIFQLTRQLERDIHRINPVLVDIILINQPDISQFDGVQFEEDQDQEDFKSPAMKSLGRQFQDVHSPRQIQQKIQIEHPSEMEPPAVVQYIWGLVNYARAKSWTNQITYNVNNNQSFQALAYLKFLRDFQVPQDEYVPIIGNEKFIQWETFYNNQQQSRYERGQQFSRQCQTIFHRCIFQVFLAQLQKNRPYGQRGRPFPWQSNYSALTIRQVSERQMPTIFQQCIHKIQQYLIYRCGLIEQKIVIMNEQELQKAHEDNEDRIIEMLEQDLVESPHLWYQMEEHGLEIKLEITEVIEQILIQQVLKLLLEFY